MKCRCGHDEEEHVERFYDYNAPGPRGHCEWPWDPGKPPFCKCEEFKPVSVGMKERIKILRSPMQKSLV